MSQLEDTVNKLYTAVCGLDDNPDNNGIFGEIKEIKKLIEKQNGRVRKLEIAVIGIAVSGVAGSGWLLNWLL